MPLYARWLVPAAACLAAVGAGVLALSRWMDLDQGPFHPGDGVDLAEVLDGFPDEGFDRQTGPWVLGLPDDHGAHPDARAETWNISAHLRNDRGADIGIQFALLRFGLLPPDSPGRGSAWELGALYRAHVTLVVATEIEASGEERFQRDVPGVAGHDAADREVWLDAWTVQYGEGEAGDQLRLDATVDEVGLALLFTPAKAAVALNPDGIAAPFRGYSLTRMTAAGFIGSGDDRQSVSGFAWLDHLWGDLPLPVGPVVLDRLQLQLDDGTDLAITRTRRRDGGGTPALTGLAIGPGGEPEALAGASLQMEPTRTWQSDSTGGRYPLDWRIRAGALTLNVRPLADDQVHDFATPMWSGIVGVEGALRGRPVSGRGTLLLTGDPTR